MNVTGKVKIASKCKFVDESRFVIDSDCSAGKLHSPYACIVLSEGCTLTKNVYWVLLCRKANRF